MGFFSGGAKSISHGSSMADTTWFGKMRGGVITNIGDEQPQTHHKNGTVMMQKDGVTPKTQVVVTVKCIGGGELLKAAYAAGDEKVKGLMAKTGAPVDERLDPSDDGRRGLYVKGTLRYDIGTELRRKEIQDPEVGGELYWVITGTRETPNGPGRTQEILYFAPPAGSKAGGFFTPEEQAAPAAAPQQSGPPAPAWGNAAPQQPAAAPPAPSAPADPWGAAPAAQQASQPPTQGGPASSPWG